EILSKRAQFENEYLYAYTDISLSQQVPTNAAYYAVRGYQSELLSVKESMLQLNSNESYFPVSQIHHGVDFTSNYIYVIFYDGSKKPIAYQKFYGPNHPSVNK